MSLNSSPDPEISPISLMSTLPKPQTAHAGDDTQLQPCEEGRSLEKESRFTESKVDPRKSTRKRSERNCQKTDEISTGRSEQDTEEGRRREAAHSWSEVRKRGEGERPPCKGPLGRKLYQSSNQAVSIHYSVQRSENLLCTV